jgi:hypothetical protein
MELEDRRDNLRLLALIARGNGFDEDLKDYTPPSVQIEEDLAESGKEAVRGEDRNAEVLRFIANTGGG